LNFDWDSTGGAYIAPPGFLAGGETKISISRLDPSGLELQPFGPLVIPQFCLPFSAPEQDLYKGEMKWIHSDIHILC